MAGTDVVEIAISTPLLTPQAFPVDENSLSPQLMELAVLVKVAFTAEVRAGHLALQVVEPLAQFESAEVLLFIEPERSRTKSTSAGWREVPLVWVPQLASPVGAGPVEPEPPPEPAWPAGLPSNLSTGAPPPLTTAPVPPPTGGVEPQPEKKSPSTEKIAVPAMMVPKTSLFMTSPCLKWYRFIPASRRENYRIS
jgi:hypothetical protein